MENWLELLGRLDPEMIVALQQIIVEKNEKKKHPTCRACPGALGCTDTLSPRIKNCGMLDRLKGIG